MITLKTNDIKISKILLIPKLNNKNNLKNIINIGNFITLIYKIQENDKQKLQKIEGLVISIQNRSISKTFTIKRTVEGISVEQTFPYYSNKIISIEKTDHVKVRRAKLYFLCLNKSIKFKGRRF